MNNNKGFTLVELLAVLVLLSAIMFVVIPSLSSSMERSKKKKLEANKKMLIAAAEMYVSDHRYVLQKYDRCYIIFDDLVEGGYATEDLIYSDSGDLTGVIVYDRINNSYSYDDGDLSGITGCS